jgi:hypothetical protein
MLVEVGRKVESNNRSRLGSGVEQVVFPLFDTVGKQEFPRCQVDAVTCS